MNLITKLVQTNEQRLDALRAHNDEKYITQCMTLSRLLDRLPRDTGRFTDVRVLRISRTVVVFNASHRPDTDKNGEPCGWDDYEIVVRPTFGNQLSITVCSEYGKETDIVDILRSCLLQEIN